MEKGERKGNPTHALAHSSLSPVKTACTLLSHDPSVMTAKATRFCLRIDLTHPFSCIRIALSFMVSVRASFSVSFSGIEEVDKVDKEEEEAEGRGSRRIWFIVNGSDSGGGGGGGGGRISPGMNVAVDELEAKAEAEIEKFCVATIRPVWVEQIWSWTCLPEV